MPKKLLIFASGQKDSGGSGARNLKLSQGAGKLGAHIVGFVSNHADGGVAKAAKELGVPLIHFPGPFTVEEYQRIVRESGADYVALSGWLKLVAGLNPATTINIHPGPLPEFGGDKMYGIHVHRAVFAACRRGEIATTSICMHFVTLKYDDGPLFFRLDGIPILAEDTPESLQQRVLALEHQWQPWATNLIVTGAVSWSGIRGEPVRYPSWYKLGDITIRSKPE